MRILVFALFASACLSAPGAAQTPESLPVRKLDLTPDQKVEIRRLLGDGESQLEAQHEQAFRDLARVLSGRQMAELREMSRWGRYGPSFDASTDAAAMLNVLSDLTHASETGQAAAGLTRLWPTPRQGQQFVQAIQGGEQGMESRLKAVFTPEQLEFLRQLERVEQSEDW